MAFRAYKEYKDEATEQTIHTTQLPTQLNWKVLVQPQHVKTKNKGGLYNPFAE